MQAFGPTLLFSANYHTGMREGRCESQPVSPETRAHSKFILLTDIKMLLIDHERLI